MTAPSRTRLDRLLARARRLHRSRRWPELARLLSRRSMEELAPEPELVYLKAETAWRRGEVGKALEWAAALEPVCRRRGNDRLHRNRLNLIGMVQFGRGRIKEAVIAWQDLAADAAEAGDEEFVARATNNLGVVHTLQGRPDEALACHARASAAYHRLGYRRGLAQSHQNRAMALRDLGFLAEADEHFREAARWARLDGSQDELARAEQESAHLFHLCGDDALARATASRALNRYRALGDGPGMGECRRVLAIVALGTGDLDGAEGHVAEALRLAQEADAVLLEAETLDVVARLRARQGRPEEVRASEKRARALYRRLGASEWGNRYRARLPGARRPGSALPERTGKERTS